MSDWGFIDPGCEIELSTPEARARAVRIIRSASWIVRMHVHSRETESARGGVSPPLIPWDELVADLKADAPCTDELCHLIGPPDYGCTRRHEE